MSIILEALKKAAREKANVTEVHTPKPDIPHLNSPTLIIMAMIFLVGFLLFISFGRHNNSTLKRSGPEAKIPGSELAATPNLSPEGYVPPKPMPKRDAVPIAIFKPKTLNPKLTLHGIIYGFGKPSVLIENKILEEGESIKGAKVVKIYNDRVELLNESSGEIFILKVR